MRYLIVKLIVTCINSSECAKNWYCTDHRTDHGKDFSERQPYHHNIKTRPRPCMRDFASSEVLAFRDSTANSQTFTIWLCASVAPHASSRKTWQSFRHAPICEISGEKEPAMVVTMLPANCLDKLVMVLRRQRFPDAGPWYCVTGPWWDRAATAEPVSEPKRCFLC